MAFVVRVFEAALLIWFALLAAIVVSRMLSGQIDASGLLQNSADDDGVAPERVLPLIAFPVALVSYAITALHADMSVHAAMPDPSQDLVMLLGGSNGLYLAGKIARS